MHYDAKLSNIYKQMSTCDFPQPLQANNGTVPLLDHKWLHKLFYNSSLIKHLTIQQHQHQNHYHHIVVFD